MQLKHAVFGPFQIRVARDLDPGLSSACDGPKQTSRFDGFTCQISKKMAAGRSTSEAS